MPRMYRAGSGWVGAMGVGVVGVILAILAVKHKLGKKRHHKAAIICESYELKDIQENDDIDDNENENRKMNIEYQIDI